MKKKLTLLELLKGAKKSDGYYICHRARNFIIEKLGFDWDIVDNEYMLNNHPAFCKWIVKVGERQQNKLKSISEKFESLGSFNFGDPWWSYENEREIILDKKIKQLEKMKEYQKAYRKMK